MCATRHRLRQHFVAGLHSDIKAQISAKLQSLDTKEKLLTAAAEIKAAVRPRNAAAAVAAIGAEVSQDTAAISAMKKELDAIRSRFGNLNIQGGEAPEGSTVGQVSAPPTQQRPREEPPCPQRRGSPSVSAGPSAPSADSGASTITTSAPAPPQR